MADLNDAASTWESGIYQIETVDPVVGGVPNPATKAGLSNIPHLQLARRTQWLKTQVDQLQTGGGYRSAETLNPTNITLVAADMGKCLIYGDTTPITITLPLISATPVGSAVEIINTSTVNVTVQRQGSDLIDLGPTTGNSIVIPPNQSLRVVRATGTSNWHLVGITAQALQSTLQASLAANGWQRLPSGLIIQWGSVALTGTTTTVTLPIAFPTAMRSAAINVASASEGGSWGLLSTSQFTITRGGPASATASFIAIGH